MPRWVPVTLSEHGGERKIDFDISHILFFQTALEIVIILNNGDCRKARESSVSSNLILIYVIKIQIIIGWKVKSSSWSNRSLDLEKLTCVVVFNSSTFCKYSVRMFCILFYSHYTKKKKDYRIIYLSQVRNYLLFHMEKKNSLHWLLSFFETSFPFLFSSWAQVAGVACVR